MRQVLKWAGVWGPGLFAAASLVAARLQPGYSHRSHYVSGLAARGQRSALVMVPGFLAFGLASSVMPVDDPVLRAVVRTAGVATLVAGGARCSTPECPRPFVDPDARPTDVVHGIASMAAFGCWLLLPLLGVVRPGPGWYRWSCAPLFVVAALAYRTNRAAAREGSNHRGTAQRAFLLPVLCWYALTALRAM